MLNLFRTKKLSAADEKNREETVELLENMMARIDLRFNELSAQVREVKLGLQEMEVRLLTKDLKDKQQYGILHYKLHERENKGLKEEIEGLEAQLNRKRPTKEQ